MLLRVVLFFNFKHTLYNSLLLRACPKGHRRASSHIILEVRKIQPHHIKYANNKYIGIIIIYVDVKDGAIPRAGVACCYDYEFQPLKKVTFSLISDFRCCWMLCGDNEQQH